MSITAMTNAERNRPPLEQDKSPNDKTERGRTRQNKTDNKTDDKTDNKTESAGTVTPTGTQGMSAKRIKTEAALRGEDTMTSTKQETVRPRPTSWSFSSK